MGGYRTNTVGYESKMRQNFLFLYASVLSGFGLIPVRQVVAMVYSNSRFELGDRWVVNDYSSSGMYEVVVVRSTGMDD